MTYRNLLPLAVLTLLVSSSPAAYAQYGWGGYGYGGGYHASTAAESYARGAADVIRSSGAANLMNSEAAINYTAAQSAELDNHLKYTNTYFEMQQANRAGRAREFAAPSSEQLHRLSKVGIPDRLSPSELDPLTGEIGWASLLQADEFAADRAKAEALFAERANNNGHLSPSKYMALQQVGNDMTAKLKAGVSNYPAQQYVYAKNFIESLMYESSVSEN